MDRKLIFLDIDGTLTTPGSNTPPESAMKAVRMAQEKGHKVFLCSGRNPGMMAPVFALGFDGAVAGAGGYVFAGDKVLFDCPMKQEEFETGMRLLKENGVFRTIEARDKTWGDEDLGDFLANAGEGNSELIRWRKALAEQLNILPMGEYDGSQKEYNFVVQDVAAHSCLNGELINRKFDKGRGVRIIAEAFGAGIEDTIGFGDSMNDLEMIETVGTSVCMDNGSPALKAKSDIVCPAVEEDGLYKAFEQLGLI